jgi:hypothetical protein
MQRCPNQVLSNGTSFLAVLVLTVVVDVKISYIRMFGRKFLDAIKFKTEILKYEVNVRIGIAEIRQLFMQLIEGTYVAHGKYKIIFNKIHGCESCIKFG